MTTQALADPAGNLSDAVTGSVIPTPNWVEMPDISEAASAASALPPVEPSPAPAPTPPSGGDQGQPSIGDQNPPSGGDQDQQSGGDQGQQPGSDQNNKKLKP
jgi:hypothetical protein